MSEEPRKSGVGRYVGIGCGVLGVVALLVIGGTAFLSLVGAGGAAYFLTARSGDDAEERAALEAARTAEEEAARAAEMAAKLAAEDAAKASAAAEDAAKAGVVAEGATATPTELSSASEPTAGQQPTSQPATATTTTPTTPTTPPATATSTASPTTTPTPTTSASSGSKVTASGDGAVVLIGGTARFPLPATVLPGTYIIEVTFPGEPPVQTGKVRVKSGENVVITCKSAMGICRPG